MNNLFNAIVIVALIGTFVLAPMPQSSPPSVASRPSETAIAFARHRQRRRQGCDRSVWIQRGERARPGTDGTWRAKAYRGTTEVQLTVDGTGKVSTD